MKATAQNNRRQGNNWLIGGAVAITLFFWTACNDPFNAPKSWILNIIGVWLLGWILFQVKDQVKQKPTMWATIFSFAYLAALSIAFVATDNKYIGFFGEYQRRTGYLSYFCLIMVFLSGAYSFRLTSSRNIEIISLPTGSLLALYGFLQHFHKDFVHWVNPYNPVLATLGNPDFAAAVMSLFLILSVGIVLQNKYSTFMRLLGALNVILLLIVIIFSQVRQGLLTSALALLIIVIIWSHQKNRITSYTLAGASLLIGVFGAFGMLNKGPLSHFFYKTSVTYRGDYWRAGWRMFTQHPMFGVGLDRYGANFRQFRDSTQSLRCGPELISNAAHNVPIQLAATGGVFVLLTFLLFTSFIFWRGIIALRKTHGAEQLSVAVIFAAWIAYEAQSLISIDNLAIAIWGYLLGGIIVGISIFDQPNIISSKKFLPAQQFGSVILALGALAISVMFYQSESAYHKFMTLPKVQTQSEISQYIEASHKPLTYGFTEPYFAQTYARNLAELGDISGAKLELTMLIKSDNRNYEALRLLSEINEYQKNWSEAITLRQKIKILDPYNPANLLKLGEDEKSSGNLSAAKSVIPLLNSFALNSQEAKQAVQDFGK